MYEDKIILIDSPDSGDTIYVYDARGNVVAKKEQRWDYENETDVVVATAYSYDDLGRLTAIDYGDDETADVTYAYDEEVDAQSFDHGKGVGRLTTVTESSGVTKYKYDSRGNVVAQWVDITGADDFTTQYAYNTNGGLSKITYPSDHTVSYVTTEYDPDRVNRIVLDIAATSVVIASDIAYAPFGDWNSMTLGNGVIATYERDLRGMPARVAYRKSDESYLLDYSYAVNNAGNITNIADDVDANWVRDFGYDALGQLVAATSEYYFGTQEYSYDAAGNRLAFNHGDTEETYEYAENTNRLIVQDPPAPQRDVVYLTQSEYNRRYRVFRFDYRALLTGIKMWAGGGWGDYDDGDMYLLRVPIGVGHDSRVPASALMWLIESFNSRWGLDMTWWSRQIAGDMYSLRVPADGDIEGMVSELAAMILENNANRVGDNLTHSERQLVREIATEMRRMEPTPPSSWVVTDGMVMMAMSGNGSAAYTYSYEPNGNMREVEYSEDSEVQWTTTLVNDAANRLTEINVGEYSVWAFSYNFMNQRVRKTSIRPENWAYVYDLAGNMIREDWGDSFGEYIYLGGHRIAKMLPTELTQPPAGLGCSFVSGDTFTGAMLNLLLVFCPAYIVIIIAYRRNGKRSKGLVFILALSGAIVGLSFLSAEADPPTVNVYYFLNDHLDTPVGMVDSNENVVAQTYLDPFGKVAYEDYSSRATQNQFRFPGQYSDDIVGGMFVYNWNRYYMPGSGRYSIMDKIDFQDGISRFNYALNNPITFLDAKGLYRSFVSNGPTHASILASTNLMCDSGKLLKGVEYPDSPLSGTCPISPTTSDAKKREWHFSRPEDARSDLSSIIEGYKTNPSSCNPLLYGMQLHRLMDSYSHWQKGSDWSRRNLSHNYTIPPDSHSAGVRSPDDYLPGDHEWGRIDRQMFEDLQDYANAYAAFCCR